MSKYFRPWRWSISFVWPVSMAAASLAALLLGADLKYGIELWPDGWAYWQGSVSLLTENRYCYFFGLGIDAWPPLYSIYLAVWQFFLGVSGRTLAVANIFLVAVAAFNWTAIFLLPIRHSQRQEGRKGPWILFYATLIMIFVATLVAAGFRTVYAHNLVYTLLPLALYVSYRTGEARGNAGFLALVATNALLVTLLLLTHNCCVALLPVLAIHLALCKTRSYSVRGLALILTCALPVALWLSVRAYLDQLQSHPIGIGVGRFTPLEYLQQLTGGFANLLGPNKLRSGTILLILLGFLTGLLLVRGKGGGSPAGRALTTYLMLCAGFAVCLFGLFNVTWIHDPLGGRFLLFLPLILFPSAVGLYWSREDMAEEKGSLPEPVDEAKASPHGRRPARALLSAAVAIFGKGAVRGFLCCVVVIVLFRQGYLIYHQSPHRGEFDPARWKKYNEFAFNKFLIVPGFIHRPPVVAPDFILVAPPYYPWIEQRVNDQRLRE